MSKLSNHREEDHDENSVTQSSKVCAVHDKNGHWISDYHYTIPLTEEEKNEAPTWETMIEMLKEMKPEDIDNHVTGFALVFTNADGIIMCANDPAASRISTINMIARAISIIAYQEDIRGILKQARIKEMIADAIHAETPTPRGTPYDSPYGRPNLTIISNDETGQYLL